VGLPRVVRQLLINRLKIKNKGKNKENVVKRITIENNQNIPICTISEHPICGKSIEVCIFCSSVIALLLKWSIFHTILKFYSWCNRKIRRGMGKY
jgi:hypothetical protein